jgi:hypothetical protein
MPDFNQAHINLSTSTFTLQSHRRKRVFRLRVRIANVILYTSNFIETLLYVHLLTLYGLTGFETTLTT